MKQFQLTVLSLSLFFGGCVVLPVKDKTHINKCEISSDRKTLKVFNGFKDNNSYYSVSGLLLLPLTGVVSGTYVAINNVYHLGEETIVCSGADEKHQKPAKTPNEYGPGSAAFDVTSQ